MDRLEWETIDNQHFQVFLRDLSADVKLNLKHMIEDMTPRKSLSHSPHGKKHVSKKDIIIQENNKRLHQKQVDKDKHTMEFLKAHIDDKDPYTQFEMLHTPEAKTSYKWNLLERYWKKRKKYFHHVLILYYHLADTVIPTEFKNMVTNIETLIDKYDVKGYMLEKLGDMLPPLNYWDQGSYTLDPWQIQVTDYIRKNESVIVKAPTSAGKTFVAMATGIMHSPILYVCPAKPVAYQVGANFQKMGYRVHYLVDGLSERSYEKQTQIFVGTPDSIEESLPKCGVSYTYAVFDEIHMINEYEMGLCYENILKMITCPCLALSATIKNSDFLRDIFHKYHSHPVHYVEYNKRFINQQRWVYTDTIHKLHPMVCYDTQGSLQDIHFSPNDCYTLYEALSDIGEDYWTHDESLETWIDSMSPDEYFTENRLMTLDESKDYEGFLKQNLDKLYETYPEYIREVKEYLSSQETLDETPVLDTLIPLFKKCKTKDLLPLLYFHTEESVSREIAYQTYQRLQTDETTYYPFHYKILEKKQELYQSYKDKREAYADSITIKSKDSQSEKESRLDEFDSRERQQYIYCVTEYYEWAKRACHKMAGPHMKMQCKNLEKEKKAFLEAPDFREQDIFQKHPSYCFSKGSPMSGNEIRDIKRHIKASTGITIEYTDPLFQLLKRGIGLYLNSFPDEYNWIVQRLVSQRRLGIVISDRTLCLGIDLPIRSVALSGYKDPQYSTSDYLQMSGRAGRRGKDKQGNIIFHGIAPSTYLSLMKGTLPLLVGSHKPIQSSYNVLPTMTPVDMTHMYHSRIHPEASPLCLTDKTDIEDPRLRKLVWSLREFQNSLEFVSQLRTLEKNLFRTEEYLREQTLLERITTQMIPLSQDTLLSLTQNKLPDTTHVSRDKILASIQDLANLCRHLANYGHPVTHRIIITLSHTLFKKCRTLLYKYRLLSEWDSH
jgi:hypothetical protein